MSVTEALFFFFVKFTTSTHCCQFRKKNKKKPAVPSVSQQLFINKQLHRKTSQSLLLVLQEIRVKNSSHCLTYSCCFSLRSKAVWFFYFCNAKIEGGVSDTKPLHPDL